LKQKTKINPTVNASYKLLNKLTFEFRFEPATKIKKKINIPKSGLVGVSQ